MYAQSQANHHRKRRARRRSGRGLIFPALVFTALVLVGCVKLFSGPFPGPPVTHVRPERPQRPAASLSNPDGTPSTNPLPSDTTAPVITGVQDLTVYVDGTVFYRSGITVTDDRDPAPVLTVDSSNVNLSSPGTYEITYAASDASGNMSRVTATVTVLAWPEDFTPLETIHAQVDAKLAEILDNGMTAKQQVKAIYTWARTQLSYGGHSDRADYRLAAYQMLQEGMGDCFGYYAVTKLMFERLEIPNLDVRKVKNFDGDSDHFWSLVSVDGGETYYHFDATPRVGDGDDFCLVTDAFLDDYSRSHKDSHNRDAALYPATPEA